MKQINYAESPQLHANTREELKQIPFARDTSMNMDYFSSRLRECRKMKGLTQKQAAEHFNILERQWRRYENQDAFPTVEGLIQIADFFNVSIDYLLGRSDISTFDPTQYDNNLKSWYGDPEETRIAQLNEMRDNTE